MFGFGKKKKKQQQEEQKALENVVDPSTEEAKKSKTRVDKLVMGAILGVAIGSVVGISIKSKKDKETQKEDRSEAKHEPSDQAPAPKSYLGRIAQKLLGKAKKEDKKHARDEDFRKIPNEID